MSLNLQIFLGVVTAIAGIVRGFTGFGGALVMAPFFAGFMPPSEAVVVIVTVQMITSSEGIRQSLRLTDWTTLTPLLFSACVASPLGIYLLKYADPVTVKRMTGVFVMVFSLTMLIGVRNRWPITATRSAFVGIASGILGGLTGMGGPPAVIYLLSGERSSEGHRASFIAFFAVLYCITFLMLVAAGLVHWRLILISLPLVILYYCGTKIGNAYFSRFGGKAFIPICSALLFALGAAASLR